MTEEKEVFDFSELPRRPRVNWDKSVSEKQLSQLVEALENTPGVAIKVDVPLTSKMFKRIKEINPEIRMIKNHTGLYLAKKYFISAKGEKLTLSQVSNFLRSVDLDSLFDKRDVAMLRERFFDKKIYEVIAHAHKVTRQRVEQIILRSMKKLGFKLMTLRWGEGVPTFEVSQRVYY